MPAKPLERLGAALSPALGVDDARLAALREPPARPDVDLGVGAHDEDFLVIYSSGSTGEPKGIVHSLASIVGSARSFATLAGMGETTRVYHHFPMFYMAGIFNLFFCPLVAGSTIVVGPRFSRSQMLRFWELPIRHGVNCLTLTPTMAHSLCRLYRRDDQLLEHVAKYEAIVSTGSALFPSIAQRFLATFGVPLRTCYGVTEVGGTVTFQGWADALAGESMGTWAATTEIRAGSAAEPSEVLVRSPFGAKGYLVRGELRRAVDDDGFFHTGDVGYLSEGRLFFSGRTHDLVKKGGEFVSTQLVESLALRCEHVVEAAVVGVPDEFWGAKLVLFYVPQPGVAEPDIDGDLARLFGEGLREVERPDKIVPVPFMPKTSIGKIIKRDLVDKYDIGRSSRA
jgi:long-chain acyl-CoA synthetase